jgi:hypothetical protein
MIQIDKLTVTVTVEGDAEAGERAFARLFDKYSALADARAQARTERAVEMTRDRALSQPGGRR